MKDKIEIFDDHHRRTGSKNSIAEASIDVKLTGKTESEEVYTSLSRPESTGGDVKIPQNSSITTVRTNKEPSIDDNIRIESRIQSKSNLMIMNKEPKIESSDDVYVDDEFESSKKDDSKTESKEVIINEMAVKISPLT